MAFFFSFFEIAQCESLCCWFCFTNVTLVDVKKRVSSKIRKRVEYKAYWNSVDIQIEVDVTLGAWAISSGFSILGKIRHFETSSDFSDLRALPGQEGRVLLSLSGDIPHEDVCPDQSDFHQTPLYTSLRTEGPSPPAGSLHFSYTLITRHLFPVAWKNKMPNYRWLSLSIFVISWTQARSEEEGLATRTASQGDLNHNHSEMLHGILAELAAVSSTL